MPIQLYILFFGLTLSFTAIGQATEKEPKVLMRQAAMHLRGDPAPADVEQAIALYRIVAERGIAFAQYRLARIYLDGQHVERDIDTALTWLKRAATLGFIEAQLELSRMYESGDILEQNLIDAYKWLQIAGSLTERDFETRQQALADKMSFLELARAEYLARRCIYRRYIGC